MVTSRGWIASGWNERAVGARRVLLDQSAAGGSNGAGMSAESTKRSPNPGRLGAFAATDMAPDPELEWSLVQLR